MTNHGNTRTIFFWYHHEIIIEIRSIQITSTSLHDCYSVKSLHQIVKQAFNAKVKRYKNRRFDPWCGSSSVYNVV